MQCVSYLPQSVSYLPVSYLPGFSYWAAPENWSSPKWGGPGKSEPEGDP